MAEVFTCSWDGCVETFKRRYELNKHVATHENPDSLHHCPSCSFYTPCARYLRIHSLQHTGTKNLSCQECPYKTNDPSSLTKHKKRVHGYIPARSASSARAPVSFTESSTRKQVNIARRTKERAICKGKGKAPATQDSDSDVDAGPSNSALIASIPSAAGPSFTPRDEDTPLASTNHLAWPGSQFTANGAPLPVMTSTASRGYTQVSHLAGSSWTLPNVVSNQGFFGVQDHSAYATAWYTTGPSNVAAPAAPNAVPTVAQAISNPHCLGYSYAPTFNNVAPIGAERAGGGFAVPEATYVTGYNTQAFLLSIQDQWAQPHALVPLQGVSSDPCGWLSNDGYAYYAGYDVGPSDQGTYADKQDTAAGYDMTPAIYNNKTYALAEQVAALLQDTQAQSMDQVQDAVDTTLADLDDIVRELESDSVQLATPEASTDAKDTTSDPSDQDEPTDLDFVKDAEEWCSEIANRPMEEFPPAYKEAPSTLEEFAKYLEEIFAPSPVIAWEDLWPE